ncbi:MAG: GNAT family N-acetyltransferase [Nitriliruptorales bacterium]|nr:GNAT family N-acetyltransferase [Nitriliruptorales bacterium]
MTQAAPDSITVVENTDEQRFEAHLDGELVGVVEYIPLPGKIVATHTEVSPRHEGAGIGSSLVTGVMEQLRRDRRRLQPQCPYVRSWLQRHEEYSDIVDPTTPR